MEKFTFCGRDGEGVTPAAGELAAVQRHGGSCCCPAQEEGVAAGIISSIIGFAQLKF